MVIFGLLAMESRPYCNFGGQTFDSISNFVQLTTSPVWLLTFNQNKTLAFGNVYSEGKIHFFKIVLIFMNFFRNDCF